MFTLSSVSDELEIHASTIIRVVVSRVGEFLSLYEFVFRRIIGAEAADASLDKNLKTDEA
jgi:DNA-directed RNA polymerase specialized sigma54-like protein